jgi:hypothetical protein
MQRLRDMRPVPGSVEEMLVEAIKAYSHLETSPIIQRRVYARVLDIALGRRKHAKRSRVRPRIGLSILVLAGAAAGATIGLHSIEKPHVPFDESPTRVSVVSGHPLTRSLFRD